MGGEARPAHCARTRSSSARACPRTRRRARRSSRLRGHVARRRRAVDRRGVPRRQRDGAQSSGTPVEIAARLRARVREQVGLPITVGVARTKFLAKVASARREAGRPARRPARRRARVPPPAPRRAAVGRRPGDGAQAARARDHDRRRGRAMLPESVLVSMLGQASGRHLHALAHNRDPRPVRCAAPARLDRLAAGARTRAVVAGERRRGPRRARRPRDAADARRRTRGPDGRPPPALRRLLARDPLAHAAARDGEHRARSSTTARALLATALPTIERRGLTLVGIAVANLDDASRCSSRCRSTRARTRRSTPSLDLVRDRFGTAAITRAVLLGRSPGLTMPLLPD